jgi:GAF domain-containing protein
VTEGPGPADPRRERALDALVEVAVRVAAAGWIAPPAGQEALRSITEATAAVVRVAAISIALHDPVSDRLIFRAAAGPQGEGVVGLSIGAHDGIAGYVFSTGQALAVAEATADARFERTTAEQTGYLPRSILAVPLIDDAGIIGVMECLDRRDGEPFDLEDVEQATLMAAAATSIARATGIERDAVLLLRSVLATIGGAGSGSSGFPGSSASAGSDVETLVGEIIERLSGDDPLWRLADRIGRLRAADPDDLDLAIAWLDALLARSRRRAGSGRRTAP